MKNSDRPSTATMRFDNLAPWLAPLAVGNQRPLGYTSSEHANIGMPFDKEFDNLVLKSMRDFKVPGLSIAVVSGPVTYSKVSSLILTGQVSDQTRSGIRIRSCANSSSYS